MLTGSGYAIAAQLTMSDSAIIIVVNMCLVVWWRAEGNCGIATNDYKRPGLLSCGWLAIVLCASPVRRVCERRRRLTECTCTRRESRIPDHHFEKCTISIILPPRPCAGRGHMYAERVRWTPHTLRHSRNSSPLLNCTFSPAHVQMVHMTLYTRRHLHPRPGLCGKCR